MLDVEHGVEIEIMPLLAAYAEPAQAGRGRRRSAGRGQLDRTERADRVIGVAARGRHRRHRIGEREALPNRRVDLRIEAERGHQVIEHRAVHALDIAAAHLVPIIAGQLQLRPNRQLHLRISDEIVEPGFARRLLGQEPAHLLEARLLGEPGEERIALAGAGLLETLEPGEEGFGIARRRFRLLGDLGAKLLDEAAFQPQHLGVAVEQELPILAGQSGREPLPVPVGEALLEVVVQELRTKFSVGKGRHEVENPLWSIA